MLLIAGTFCAQNRSAWRTLFAFHHPLRLSETLPKGWNGEKRSYPWKASSYKIHNGNVSMDCPTWEGNRCCHSIPGGNSPADLKCLHIQLASTRFLFRSLPDSGWGVLDGYQRIVFQELHGIVLGVVDETLGDLEPPNLVRNA